MINPLLGSRRYLFIYTGFWAIIIVAHLLLLYYFYNLPLLVSIADALIYNPIFFLLGFGIWYIVMYNPFEIKNLPNLIITHFLSALFLCGLWLSTAGLLTSILFVQLKESDPFSDLIPVRIMLGIICYMIIVLVYYLIIYYRNLKEKIEHQAYLEARFKEAELNTLKSQINPHFIFNSLNSISSLTISNPVLAQEMIVKLSDFFRKTLKKDNSQFTLLSEEMAFSRLYFEIEKIRFGNKLHFKIDCLFNKENIIKVPHLILQPLLENAVKHGVQESIKTVEITLTCRINQQVLILEVANEFDPELNIKGHGIGHQNIRERLRLIYDRNDLLEIKIFENRYIAILKIPLLQNP